MVAMIDAPKGSVNSLKQICYIPIRMLLWAIVVKIFTSCYLWLKVKKCFCTLKTIIF